MNRLKTCAAPGMRLLAGLMLVAGLVGCGNSPDKAQGWTTLYTAYGDQRESRKAEKKAESGGGQAASQAGSIQGAMKNNSGPLMLAVIDETKRTAILGKFGQNGPYSTWRTASRQTLTFRDGFLTGTRGLGYDLLSSEANGSIALVQGRRSGEVQRVYHHLSGENHDVPTRMTCQIATGATDKVVYPTGKSVSATIMKETCRSDALKVKNTYWVTGSGRIVQSIQWVSPEVGKIAFQTIRD